MEDPPQDFELHASELLSPEGEGPFTGWDRGRRNALALDLLQLVDERRHQLLIQFVNKSRMAKTTPPDKDFGFGWKDPWEVAFAAVLTMAEEFLRSTRTGRSSTGMVVIDHEPRYLEVVRAHSRGRQLAKGWQQVRKVMEIGYSATRCEPHDPADGPGGVHDEEVGGERGRTRRRLAAQSQGLLPGVP